LGQRKGGLLRQVTSLKNGSSHMKSSMTGPDKGNLLIQVTA